MLLRSLFFGIQKKDKNLLVKEIGKKFKIQEKEVYDLNELKECIDKEKLNFVFVSEKVFPLDKNGDLLMETKLKYPLISFIIVGPDDIDSIIEYVKKGADYYLISPIKSFNVKKLLQLLKKPSDSLASQLKKETTLFQIIKQISFTMELDPLLNLIIDSSMELTGASIGSLLLYNKEEDLLSVHSLRGVSKDENEIGFLNFPENYLKEVIKNGKLVYFPEKEYLNLPHRNPSYKSIILSPISSSIGGFGLLINAKRIDEEGDFSPESIRLVSVLASEITPAVRNSLLHNKARELIIKDDLTDAYNRRFFEKFLEDEVEKSRKFQTTLSIIFLDIDNLKEVNEKHGHLMGSKVLQEVAHRIILSVRGIDKVVRYGGDEFCIILPETDTSGAFLVAERIRNTIANKPFLISEGLESYLTASFGIASFPKHANSKNELIRKADEAMFLIKSSSKNGISVAQ